MLGEDVAEACLLLLGNQHFLRAEFASGLGRVGFVERREGQQRFLWDLSSQFAQEARRDVAKGGWAARTVTLYVEVAQQEFFVPTLQALLADPPIQPAPNSGAVLH